MSFLAQLQQQNQKTSHPLKLYYCLSVTDTTHYYLPQLTLELIVGETLSDDTAKPYTPQKDHLRMPPPFIDASDLKVLSVLVQATHHNGWPVSDGSEIALSESELFAQDLLATKRVYLQCQGRYTHLTHVKTINAELQWVMQPSGTQLLQPELTPNTSFCIGSNALQFFALDNQSIAIVNLHTVQNALSDIQKYAVLQFMKSDHYPLKVIDRLQFEQSYSTTWQSLSLPQPDSIHSSILNAQVRGAIRCHFDDQTNILTPEFLYIHSTYCTEFSLGDAQHDPSHHVLLNKELFCIERKAEQETAFLAVMKKAFKGFDKINGGYTTEDDTLWQRFFLQDKPQLEKSGCILRITGNFTRHYIQADTWISTITQKNKQSLQVDFFIESDNKKINLLTLLDQIHQFNLANKDGQVSLTLGDGKLLLLPAEQLIKLTEEFGDALTNGSLALPYNQRNRLAQLENLLPSCHWEGELEHLEMSRSLAQKPILIDQTDCHINATLRPYQWLGVCWLQHLKQANVNGLLADDMGLGKTLQTIGHLRYTYGQGQLNKPVLIVVPKSLLHNWENEFKKFSPDLNTFIYHGAHRKKAIEAASYDILLTSYHLVANDLDYFEQQYFSWLILDEAQAIKNPKTRSHQALKNITSDYKLCLSGTPIENNLTELWALFDFLMPGCLGPLSSFKFHFQKPIEQEGNHKKLAQLLERIGPFMLRRTKEAVATDLPKKTIIQQTIDFCDVQARFYENIKNDACQTLQDQLEGTQNTGEQQLFVLSALMKLRQACCDPALLGEDSIPSAKRQYCNEMVSELVAEGRAVLIFSQFTSMLDLLASDFKALDIPYGLLTGKTQNRQALVDRFQTGEFPVFLISLKAGGVGLNLTRADTVIHYDPWWNSAAEAQATDRAHRIGQKNAVFVYKLITENTIEEKIALLQANKAQLGNTINQQAQDTGTHFSLKLEELLLLLRDDTL